MRFMSPVRNGSWPTPRIWSDPLVDDFFYDFERMFDSMLEPTLKGERAYTPACDVSESEDHFMISFDLPGVRNEDLNVEVKDDRLYISGERRRDLKSEENGVVRHERGFGRFQRVFKLPTQVDAEQIQAQYDNGVLSIALPKTPKAKGRTIQIQSGKSSLFSRLLGSTKRDEGTEANDAQAS